MSPAGTQRPRRSTKATKPDYGDAGYGQIGCLIMAVGILAGGLVSLLLGLWLDPAMPPLGDAFLIRLGGIVALGFVVGTVASVALGYVVERVPALWSRSDAVFVAGFGGALVTVPVAIYMPVVGDLAWPIVGLAAVVACAPIVWVIVVRLWRGPAD